MTTFRACVVIPTFNNPRTIRRVVERVRDAGVDVVVVDDGSAPEARQIAESLTAMQGVDVMLRERNGGKGSAVGDGLSRARQLGFTHAMQVDADDQHCLDDIPRFLAAARAAPDALVLGYPQFDSSAPLARLWGRQLTVFWTHVETGGRVIKDPMCGFRVYPLAAVAGTRVAGRYMDFDPEIAVRLVWAGTPVLNLPTQVRYLSAEDGGVSHFRLVRDNVRISWMHTRLVCLAVLRLLGAPLRVLA